MNEYGELGAPFIGSSGGDFGGPNFAVSPL